METTAKKRTVTEAALAAKEIKQALKKAYPQYKFTVKSSTYSMGDSITVTGTDICPVHAKSIKKFIDVYQGGDFDGMTEIYNYRPSSGKPTVKYVFFNNDKSPEAKAALRELMKRVYRVTDEQLDHSYEHEQTMYRIFSGNHHQEALINEFWGSFHKREVA